MPLAVTSENWPNSRGEPTVGEKSSLPCPAAPEKQDSIMLEGGHRATTEFGSQLHDLPAL